MADFIPLYAVMGHPVEHSLSPAIHPLFAHQCHKEIRYEKICVASNQFPAAVKTFFLRPGARGLNVTVPLKQQAHDLCVHLSSRAASAGAVNTLCQRHGQLFGDNTDGIGLVRDIEQNLRWPIAHKRILIVGAGGAVRGVLGPLLAKNPSRIMVLNRTYEKAIALKQAFDGIEVGSLACPPNSIVEPIDLIINGTSASLEAQAISLPDIKFNLGALAYDLMYSALPTTFLKWAKQQGAAHCSDGLGMLIEQAADSFCLWENFQPETASVIQIMRDQLTI